MAGILIRFFMALVLVFATWNPTGWSFVHWLLRTLPAVTAPLAFAGVVLLIGWILFLHATLESLGMLGILLAGAFFGSLTWLLFDLGWLSAQNDVMSYVALALIAAVLAVGMSWSHIWRRLSGQVDVDEVDHH
jgi:Na+/melibiose symporter-like transporter